ncbi:BID domain-containing T4SS effector [Bartonella massiliensis]|uniref:BID domain-containing T4SS effector n=1 Tax=Bartonella massiliensis TaxID=929795 RepID=UPI001159609B|nr:BID domain-containing T4SS effector [Bartonella massiliensis]
MKKRTPSPLIAEMMTKFQQQAEQSSTKTSPSQVSQSAQKPPAQKRSENLSTTPKIAPPKPPRVRDRAQASTISPSTPPSSAKTQETSSLETKVAPPKPPRAKERQQPSPQVQASPSHPKMASTPPPRVRENPPTDAKVQKLETIEHPSTHIKAAPQRPPRAKDKIQTSTKIQELETLERPSAHIKTVPQRPPRAKDRLQNKPTTQENEGLYATPRAQTPPHIRDTVQSGAKIKETPPLQTEIAPPKPPRAKERLQHGIKIQNPETHAPNVRPKTSSHRILKQQSSSSSQDSETYAVPPSRKPHRKGDRQKSDAVAQKTGSPQTAIKQPKPSQEQKTSLNKMEKELLLVAYQEEIRFLCEKVYGNRLILEQKIEAIKENPAMGEQLLWDIKENPLSIAKLAGKKALGIKNGARKTAEESLPSLCDAINGYLYTSKYLQENISQHSQTRPQTHEQEKQEGSIKQHIQNPFNSEKTIKPLSNPEIARRVQQDPTVQYGQREIQYWCKIVYKDPLILQYIMEDMQKIPGMGEELVFQIESNPTFFAPLAGRKTLGIKNGARKAAEENLPTLCTAIKDYAETIKQLRETIVQNHKEEQEQQRHQSLTDPDKKLQKQQNLSHLTKLPEHSTAKRRQELAETSRQEEQPPVRARRVETSKAMALS